jgi:alkanesulfonate monooxygenase SsuD/methylene tetrahydromethanopterin reductase-like flavin-dependent oxidoreductase (luciferase family)
MKLVTTVALAALRGPVPLAKALSALDELSDGRVIAGVGPGSSRADYDAVGVPFEQRWQRFDETLQLIKAMLQPATAGSGARAESVLPPSRRGRGIPVWIGSWGSRAGMRRVARAGDGWLASAYNTTPEAFTAAMEVLGGELESQQRPSGDFPNALVTMSCVPQLRLSS